MAEISESLPILIAKQKNAKILKDDYKIGYFFQNNNEYSWLVFASCKNIENAIIISNQIISEKEERIIYLSNVPVERDKVATLNFELIKVKTKD